MINNKIIISRHAITVDSKMKKKTNHLMTIIKIKLNDHFKKQIRNKK